MNRRHAIKPNPYLTAMCLSSVLTLAVFSGVAAAREMDFASTAAPEQRTLDEIYQAALAEGGKLVVYAGGDVPDGNAGIEKAFKARFPGIDIRIVTDLSKYHDTRIDQQLRRGNLECDVAHLQTMHDYDRWKAEGVLEQYFPLGWDAVYPEFKDPDGAFTAIKLFSFSNIVSSSVPDSETPRDALDYLNPRFKGKLVMTYPHDDDAVLFQFDRTVQSGDKLATFTATGSLAPEEGVRFVLPREDTFLVWPQMAAIFRASQNKEAARLYVSWMLDADTMRAMPYQWVVRRDVENPAGCDAAFAYNTDTSAFRRFMADRARIERLKGQFEHLIGPATGDNPTQAKGLYLVKK